MKTLILMLALIPSLAFAEYAVYGDVELTGLARNQWDEFEPGTTPAMVCNVNGTDGFLSVRSGAGSRFRVRRNLNRLAILDVDTRYRDGHWIYVNIAYRMHDPDGNSLGETKYLPVQGWVHDGYLCSFSF